MASRVAGAVLALLAAALLVVAVVLAPWWSGHPKFNGAEIHAKTIDVTPLGATGCNTGGDGSCMSVPVAASFETVGFALAGVAALLAITCVALGVFTVRGHARRKTFAIFVIVGSMIAALLAVVLVVVGPQIRTEAPLPFSMGLFVFFGGVTAALGASLFAMRAQPVARAARSRPSLPAPQHASHSPHGGVDVHALLADDAAVRPSSPGPFGRASAPAVPSPGGMLPGPSGPLGQPLFSGAPQLRPLYEASQNHGGTGGFVPQVHQTFPISPPTPVPLDRVSAIAGIPTPAMIEAQRSVTMAAEGAPPPPPPLDVTDRDLLGAAGMRAPRPKTLPPPTRGKPVTAPPGRAASIITAPPGRAAAIPPAGPLVQARPLPTLANAVVPPPPNQTLATPPRTPDPEEQFDAMQTYQRDDASGLPPRSAPEVPPIAQLVAAASSPMTTPAPPPTTTPPPTPPQKSAQQKAASIAARVAAMGPPLPKPAVPLPKRTGATPTKPPPPKPPEEVSPDTDVSVQALADDRGAGETIDSAPPAGSVTVDEDAMTVGREKISRTDLELPVARPPTETAQTLLPPEKPTEKPTEKPPEKPTEKPTEKPKLPISTAPDSLPPPTAQEQAASGPSPACPQCEAPMAWVEAHLRFYCKSCKMYF